MFSCTHCDAQSPKWAGRCAECGQWGTLVDEGETVNTSAKKSTVAAAPVLRLSEASILNVHHVPTGIVEFDRVLGGGIVPGSVTLLAGEPGIGKSTLVAQLAQSVGKSVYYASGEESEGQIKLRLSRLGIAPERISFSNTVDVLAVIAAAEKLKPDLVIVDSIQTMLTSGVESLPGSPTAVKAATAELISYAKRSSVPVLIIGQITKEGAVAGPKTLEHLVDTVLTLEGDPQSAYRLLRASKHRFGSTDEVGVLEMTEKGLITVDNPSARFLDERVPGAGSVVTCIMEGARPFLVEIQALVEKTYFANPVRRTSGIDAGRLQMLIAIVSKRTGLPLHDKDIFVNVVGGMKIREHAADLAIACAIVSAANNVALPSDAVVIGELGLGGEVRSVSFLDRRLKEADRLGLKKSFTPKTVRNLGEISKM